MVNVVLAVGERFASKGVAGMVEHSLKGLFDLLPRDTLQESQPSEAI